MTLPGGCPQGRRLLRSVRFRPASGALELSLAEAWHVAHDAPRRVTAILSAALEHLGGRPATPARVRRLSVGDRHFLTRQLLAHLGREPLWLTSQCHACGHRFDVQVRPSELPTKPAGAAYPLARVRTSAGALTFRVPNGGDQEALAGIEDESEACDLLLARCRVRSRRSARRHLRTRDRARVEAALEDVSPEVTTRLEARCAECGQAIELDLNPCVGLDALGSPAILDEIHTLAAAYHWSETDILRLPSGRRRFYLDRVASAPSDVAPRMAWD